MTYVCRCAFKHYSFIIFSLLHNIDPSAWIYSYSIDRSARIYFYRIELCGDSRTYHQLLEDVGVSVADAGDELWEGHQEDVGR